MAHMAVGSDREKASQGGVGGNPAAGSAMFNNPSYIFGHMNHMAHSIVDEVYASTPVEGYPDKTTSASMDYQNQAYMSTARKRSYAPDSMGDNPSFSGFHIGDGGYRYPPSNGFSGGPPAGYYMGEMDIKMDPDNMIEQGYQTPSPLSGYPSPGSGFPDFDGLGNRAGNSAGRKNKEDKLCGVCGDRALGYNFDAISCESCKAFFRRNAPKGLEYFKCPYDEKCKMDISNRRFCKRCRLKKCFEIGMRKEYILTDTEKAVKRQKIEQNRWRQKSRSSAVELVKLASSTHHSRPPPQLRTSSPSACSRLTSCVLLHAIAIPYSPTTLASSSIFA